MQGTNVQNLRLFRDLCGDGDLKTTILTATFWENLRQQERDQKLSELRQTPEFWGEFVKRGARTLYWDNKRAHGLQVLQAIANENHNVDFGHQEVTKSRVFDIRIVAGIINTCEAYISTWKMSKMAKKQGKMMQEEMIQGEIEQANARARAREEREAAERKLDQEYETEAAATREANCLAKQRHDQNLAAMAQRVREEEESIERLNKEHEAYIAGLLEEEEKAQQDFERQKQRENEKMQNFYTSWECTRKKVNMLICDACHKKFSGSYYREYLQTQNCLVP